MTTSKQLSSENGQVLSTLQSILQQLTSIAAAPKFPSSRCNRLLSRSCETQQRSSSEVGHYGHVPEGMVQWIILYVCDIHVIFNRNLTPTSEVDLAVYFASFPSLPALRAWSSGLPLTAAVSLSYSPALVVLGVAPRTCSPDPSRSLAHV
jgi:hypothetical protein